MHSESFEPPDVAVPPAILPLVAPRLPKDPTPQIVQVFQFVSRAERAHVQPIVTYVMRMRKEMQGLFATTVSKSGSAAMFATNKDFGMLMAQQRNFF